MLFSCKCLNLVIRVQKPNATTAERPNLLANHNLPKNVGMEFFKQVPQTYFGYFRWLPRWE